MREIRRVVAERRRVDEIAGVIDHHDDHHDAAQQVDGIETPARRRRRANRIGRSNSGHGPRILMQIVDAD